MHPNRDKVVVQEGKFRILETWPLNKRRWILQYWLAEQNEWISASDLCKTFKLARNIMEERQAFHARYQN
jgi:hypothetical protein